MSSYKKYLLDTNILIDLCSLSRPEHDKAKMVILYLAFGKSDLFATTCSLKDCYYTLSNHYGDQTFAKVCIQKLILILSLVSIEPSFVEVALKLNEPDFEDALIRATAEANKIDAIITRDTEAFENAKFQKLTLDDLMKEISK